MSPDAKRKRRSPAVRPGSSRVSMPIVSSIADANRVIVPTVAVPIAPLLPVAAGRRGRRAFIVHWSGGIIVRGWPAGRNRAADEGAPEQAGREADAHAVMRFRGRRGKRTRDRRDRKQGSKGLLHVGSTPGDGALGAGLWRNSAVIFGTARWL